MPVPSVINNIAAAKKAAIAQQHYQQYQQRRALAPLKSHSRASLSPGGALMPIAGRRHPNQVFGGRGGSARNSGGEDENTPYGGGNIYKSSRSFVLGVNNSVSAVDNITHVSAGASQHGRSRQQLASWPPSPQGLPPTPTFFEQSSDEEDLYRRPAEYSLTSNAMVSADVYRENPASWHPAPVQEFEQAFLVLPDLDNASTVAVVSGGEAHSPDSVEVAPHSLVPSPTEVLKIANEQARANAAVHMSDWISEAVWEVCAPLMGNYDLLSSQPLRRSGSFGNSAPPSFKRFVHQTIYQVSASAGSLALALWYIQRLPIGHLSGDGPTDIEHAFRDDLIMTKSEIPWRLLVLGLTLSNKWLEDNTFTTKTWHEVTGLTVPSMKSIETKALALFNWVLSPTPDEWLSFLQLLRRRETHGTAPSAIGSERHGHHSPSSLNGVKRPLRDIDELIAQVRLTKNSVDPVFPGMVQPANMAPGLIGSPVSPASSLASSFYDDDDVDILPEPISPPPRTEQIWQARPASWADVGSSVHAARQEHQFESTKPRRTSAVGNVYYPHRLQTPAPWDPAATVFDSPHIARKPMPSYEAVQRPSPPSDAQNLIPPPPLGQSFEEYAYAAVPRAAYTIDHRAYVPPSAFTTSSATGERAWYDSKLPLPRSIGLTDGHMGSSWASFAAGMIRSF